MATYGEDYDEIQKRNRGYFPNLGAGMQRQTPTQIQQRINSMPRLQRNQLQTYTLPSGGTVTIPAGSQLPSGYSPAAVPPAEANLIRQQGVAQGYYGTQPSQFPTPAPAPPGQYAGGPYTTQGGVVNPVTFPNVFQRIGSGVTQAASGLYNLPATQSLIGSTQNMFSNLYTNLFGSRTTAPTRPAYAYRPPLVMRNQPRSYFDDQNYGY